MNAVTAIGVSLGTAWASGINLYAAVATLGCLHRFGGVELPGEMDLLAHPAIIILAVTLYVVEFVADKVPYFDSIWDVVHTFIRVPAGAGLAYSACADLGGLTEMIFLLLGGGVALTAHGTKAATRIAANASPEPFSNWALSTGEDVAVFGRMWLVIRHPVIASVLVLAFVVAAIYFVPKIIRAIWGMLVRVGRFISGARENQTDVSAAE